MIQMGKNPLFKRMHMRGEKMVVKTRFCPPHHQNERFLKIFINYCNRLSHTLDALPSVKNIFLSIFPGKPKQHYAFLGTHQQQQKTMQQGYQ